MKTYALILSLIIVVIFSKGIWAEEQDSMLSSEPALTTSSALPETKGSASLDEMGSKASFQKMMEEERKRDVEMTDRYEKLLEKNEEQSERYERILDQYERLLKKWEKQIEDMDEIIASWQTEMPEEKTVKPALPEPDENLE